MRRVPQSSSSDPKVKLITAAVATGSLGTLGAMSATGLFSLMPVWAAVLIVVIELVIPFVVYRFLKRAQERR